MYGDVIGSDPLSLSLPLFFFFLLLFLLLRPSFPTLPTDCRKISLTDKKSYEGDETIHVPLQFFIILIFSIRRKLDICLDCVRVDGD